MKHHFKNLAISYLHACGMLFGVVGLLCAVGLLWDDEMLSFETLGLITAYTLIAALLWLFPAYLIIGTPYYFGLIIKRPWVRPGAHYAAVSLVASAIIFAPFSLEPWNLETTLTWLVTSTMASLTAITGTRTLIKRSNAQTAAPIPS